MQCPRCGLQNAPDAARCLRCSHDFEASADQPAAPAPGQQRPGDGPALRGDRHEDPAQLEQRRQDTGWQHSGYTPKPPPPPPAPPEPEYGSVWRILAAIALPIAAIACIGYGAWAMIERRGIFADLADGEPVTAQAARDSDQLNTVLLWLAIGALVVAVLLWLIAHFRRKKPLGTAGFTAVALIVTGSLVLLGGAYMTSLVDGAVSEADTAAVGFLIMGGGSLLLGGGAISALVAVFLRPPRADVPAAGFAGWDG